MKASLKDKFVAPIVKILSQGISPPALAIAVSAGIVIAIIPVFGVSTLLCLLVIYLFRLNPAVVLLANQLAYPFQFILFVPFIKAGEWLFRTRPLPLSLSEISILVQTDVIAAASLLWDSILRAFVVWLLISAPLAWMLFLGFRSVFERIRVR